MNVPVMNTRQSNGHNLKECRFYLYLSIVKIRPLFQDAQLHDIIRWVFLFWYPSLNETGKLWAECSNLEWRRESIEDLGLSVLVMGNKEEWKQHFSLVCHSTSVYVLNQLTLGRPCDINLLVLSWLSELEYSIPRHRFLRGMAGIVQLDFTFFSMGEGSFLRRGVVVIILCKSAIRKMTE